MCPAGVTPIKHRVFSTGEAGVLTINPALVPPARLWGCHLHAGSAVGQQPLRRWQSSPCPVPVTCPHLSPNTPQCSITAFPGQRASEFQPFKAPWLKKASQKEAHRDCKSQRCCTCCCYAAGRAGWKFNMYLLKWSDKIPFSLSE